MIDTGEHAYTSTVHAAQGRTSDAAILHLDSAHSTITGHESWYVGLSRARQDVRVYVDDMARLPGAVRRSLGQEAALDAVQIVHELQR